MSSTVRPIRHFSRYSQLRLTVSFRPGWQGGEPAADYRLLSKPFDQEWSERGVILFGSQRLSWMPTDLSDAYSSFVALAEQIQWMPEISGQE